jgi:hypothetical protein
MDSYGSHINLNNSKSLEKYNIHVILVPPNLTGLLQPLDVAVNRSFQQYYETKYDSYINHALSDAKLQTKKGNIKVPNYKEVSDWVVEWISSKDAEFVKKAFVVCGIVEKINFNLEDLHKPLREILNDPFDFDYFLEKNSNIFKNDLEFFDDDENTDDFYMPQSDVTSFMDCIAYKSEWSGNLTDFINLFAEQLIEVIVDSSLTQDCVDNENFDIIRRGEVSTSNVEIYCTTILKNWNISLVDLDENFNELATFLFEVENPDKTVKMLRHNNCYMVKK